MNSRISSYFFFILLLAASVGAIVIFLPFLTPVVLGAAASVIVYPIYRKIYAILGSGGTMSMNISALLTVLLVLVVILVPIFFLMGRIYTEIQALYAILTDESGRSQVIQSLNAFSQTVSDSLFGIFPAYSFDSLNITEYLKTALVWLFTNLDIIFTGLIKVGIYVFVFLLSMYYFMRDGARIKRRFISWSPLLDRHDEYITATLKRAVLSVFGGTIVISVIQGILTGLGFFLFGIPAPAVWGSVAAVAAFIPGLGTSLVIVPGILYLLITGSYTYALGLALWGVLAVGLIDNFLGPHLINRGIHIHPFLILISVLGGLTTFGPVGFILGPLILAFLFALLEIYRTSFSGQIEEENKAN